MKSLKIKADDLDVDKLKIVLVDLNKWSDPVDNETTLKTKVNDW